MYKTIFIVAVILLNAVAAFAQETVPLETILNEAQKQTENYRETFRDLLAEENKTFEQFDKSGNSDKKTTVKSNFLVYQSGKDTKSTAELRNVVEVNGKSVPDGQKRSEEFLAELQKTTTLEKELKQIQSEGSRFDKTYEIYGLTLNEAVALAPNLRPYFDFKLLGTENYQGTDVYVVGFQQTKKSPFSTVNGKENGDLSFSLDIPGALKKNDKFLRGKLYIDARTFQLRREERELTVLTPEPVTLLSSIAEYQPSDYEIFVPKNISLTFYRLKKEKNGAAKYAAIKDSTLNLDYSKFKKSNVEIRILDDDEGK